MNVPAGIFHTSNSKLSLTPGFSPVDCGAPEVKPFQRFSAQPRMSLARIFRCAGPLSLTPGFSPVGKCQPTRATVLTVCRALVWTCLLSSLPLFTGCITKAKANAQARAAFVAGEQQAMSNMEQLKARGPSVTVIGEVKNQHIPWTSELTLAKAVVAAQYLGTKDPSEIVIVRQGKAMRYDPKKLLAGEDVPLEPQDLIQLSP